MQVRTALVRRLQNFVARTDLSSVALQTAEVKLDKVGVAERLGVICFSTQRSVSVHRDLFQYTEICFSTQRFF